MRCLGPATLAFIAFTSTACGAGSSGPAESSTLEVGHRVGGGRVAGASPTEIAVSTGMFADLEVFEPGTLEGGGYAQEADQITGAVIRSARSSDEATVRIDSFRGSYAKIEGMRPGTAELTFETDRGVRTFAVHVAEPALVTVRHWVWERLPEETSIAFVRGGVARFEMTRRDMAHRVLGGYGAALPVRVDPPRAARLSIRDGDVEHVDVHLEQVHTVVTLRPLGGNPIPFTIVEPSPDDHWGLSAVDVEAGETELDGLTVGDRRLVIVWSKDADGRRLLGVMGRAGLVSITPEICEAESQEDVYGDGVYRVSALALGECQLEVQVGDTALSVAVPVDGPNDGPAESGAPADAIETAEPGSANEADEADEADDPPAGAEAADSAQ